ncbi:hypothetical protein ACS0TY_022050 [Phlomoides rotata]
MIESERLSYIRNNQDTLRVEKFSDLTATRRGDTDPSTSGKRFMPTSFTGGPRYMKQNFQDVMHICKWYSYPDLFITVTCNPKWPEISRFLHDKHLQSQDRPDILCRMFKMKLDALIHDLRENKIFGKVEAIIYTVEFQKRGLPHAHILLFLSSDNKIPTPTGVNRIISAEIPNKNLDIHLYDLVKEYMMHGPCGNAKRNSHYLHLSEEELKNFALVEIEKILQQNGSSLTKFESMPLPNQTMSFEANNMLIQEELCYDKSAL